MKKKILYNTLGCDPVAGFKNGTFFPKEIRDSYEFIKSDKPEYVFCSSFMNMVSDLTKFPNAVKIFFSGENVNPDFIFFDYWIGFDFLDYNGRFFRYPLCFWEGEYNGLTYSTNNKKEYFCDFIYGHNDVNGLRKKLFNSLSEYKKVSSFGKLYNNTGIIVDMKHKDEVQSKCKFSLVIESCSNDGFITEKIVHALNNRTIPIYFGTSRISEYFNSKRFINANDYDNDVDKIIEVVKQIDSNDDLYNKIVSEPIYNSDFSIDQLREKYVSFLRNIFDSDPILRRDVNYSNKRYMTNFKSYKKFTVFVKFSNLLKRIFK